MSDVAILGCGPSGLFAAQALAESGVSFDIYSKPRKSHMFGAQYLHRPIGELSKESFLIDYQLTGSVEGYRDKVYHQSKPESVSVESLVGLHDAWDIREAYDAAWERFGGEVRDWDATKSSLPSGYDLVISTVPAKLLCEDPMHSFIDQKVYSSDFVAEELEQGEQDIVLCSGYLKDWWYRTSRIQGWETTEYVHTRKVLRLLEFARDQKGAGVWEVSKPLKTDCDCGLESGRIRRMGRYGEFKKGVLSHEAYYDTLKLVEEEL